MKRKVDLEFDRVYNFSPGPSCFPIEVLKEAQEQFLNYNHEGMSVVEMSHRGKPWAKILAESEMRIKELLNVPDGFKILFLGGGASMQFAGIPLNLIEDSNNYASYAVTGTWSRNAIGEARKYGRIHCCLNTEASNFTTLPPVEEWDIHPQSKYVHYCYNETVHGVEFQETPNIWKNMGNGPKPLLISDMSSNFCSKPVDFENHSLVYAGAQKNIGPSGVTIVIIKESIAGKELSICPTVCNYATKIKMNSMYNTPPCFNIYMVMLMAKYIKEHGGVTAMDELRTKKSQLIYDIIDNSDGFYVAPVDKKFRSKMNIRFHLFDKEDENTPARRKALEAKFLEEAAKNKLYELSGHRSIGGFRASLYTGMTIAGCEALADFMKEFQQENAS